LKEDYEDCFSIGNSAYKFAFDFGQIVPNGKETTRYHTQMITGLNTAKTLIETVGQSIKDYENQFGKITQSTKPRPKGVASTFVLVTSRM